MKQGKISIPSLLVALLQRMIQTQINPTSGTGKIELGGDTPARGEVVATGQVRATIHNCNNANIYGNPTVDGTFNVGTLAEQSALQVIPQ